MSRTGSGKSTGPEGNTTEDRATFGPARGETEKARAVGGMRELIIAGPNSGFVVTGIRETAAIETVHKTAMEIVASVKETAIRTAATGIAIVQIGIVRRKKTTIGTLRNLNCKAIRPSKYFSRSLPFYTR